MSTNFSGISAQRYLATGNAIEGARDAFLSATSGSSFKRTANKIASALGTQDVDYAAAYDADSMSFEEYKTYITGVIDGMSLHPTRQDDQIAVNINDEVLTKMKGDSDYANWVLNQIRKDFESSAASSADRQAYALSWITDAFNEYQTERWLSPFDSDYGASKFASKSKSSLWSNVNANMTMTNLLIKAQQKQMDMAQQAALQMQAAQQATTQKPAGTTTETQTTTK